MSDLLRFADERAEGEIAATMLRTTQAVRERCGQLLARAREGHAGHFAIDAQALEAATRSACARIRHQPSFPYPPLFGLWRGLQAGGIHRIAGLEDLMTPLSPAQRTHARIDLTVTAALVGGAPGDAWSYTEASTGQVLHGADGLGVATLHAFAAGLFSSDPECPWQADARGLRALLTDHLALALQVSETNPLPDLQARTIRLRRFGEWLSGQPEVYGDPGRPAGLFDIIISPYGHGVPHTADVHVHDILSQLLVTLSGLSPASPRIGSVPLGDCGRHPAVQGPGASGGWVPLHAALQGLAASLVAPFAWGGVQVRGLASLTAAADAALGELLLDRQVLRLRDPQAARVEGKPGDPLTVEWRALTVALLDVMTDRARDLLGLEADALPAIRLAQVLADEASTLPAAAHPRAVTGSPAPPPRLPLPDAWERV